MEAPRQTPSYRLVLTLGIAGFLSGLIIVGVYEWTRPKILAHQAEALRKAVLEVLPGAVAMRPLVERDGGWQIAAQDPAGAAGSDASAESGTEAEAGTDAEAGADAEVGTDAEAGSSAESATERSPENGREAPRGERAFAGFDGSGDLVGYAFEGEGGGFQDVIRLLYGFDPRGRKIVGMRVLESRETPGLGDKIYKDPEFVDDFDALAVDPEILLVKGEGTGQPNEVHAITGATISSRAVVEILRTTQSRWEKAMPTMTSARSTAAGTDAALARAGEEGDGGS